LNILIVNGSGAIGSSIVRGLNEHDVNLIITSSTGENVHGNKTIQWKYSGSESVEDLFNSIKSKYDQIDSAVNCLGSIFIKPAHLTSEDDFDNTINMNLKSSFLLLKHTIPMMRKNGGNLLFFSSAAANIGMVNHEAIAAAKGGVEAMVKSAAATYAKNNINVNAIAPGLVDSNLSKNIISNASALEISKKMHSIGRIGVPKDISKFAIPLIIDNSSWVSGSVFNIDGGLSTTKIAS
jgi:NAD(P)-dependent dehydrogenase (short-subunit alcohol dehydrogenase family)|tara:strand:+ start:2093 stop:2803 length:711 start_codon:yes stop_codon:yes gene_type:complete